MPQTKQCCGFQEESLQKASRKRQRQGMQRRDSECMVPRLEYTWLSLSCPCEMYSAKVLKHNLFGSSSKIASRSQCTKGGGGHRGSSRQITFYYGQQLRCGIYQPNMRMLEIFSNRVYWSTHAYLRSTPAFRGSQSCMCGRSYCSHKWQLTKS